MRYKYIDQLKGFLIILVVIAHVSERYFLFDLYPKYTYFFRIVYNFIYAFHMPLFIMISGFLYSLSYVGKNYEINKHKILNHELNLIIIYIIFSFFAYFTKLFFNRYVLETISSWHILGIVYNPIGHLWYLHTLIILYFFNTIILIKKFNHKVLLFIFILLQISSSYVHPYLPNVINNFLKYEFYFYIGLLLSKKRLVVFSNPHKNNILGLVSVFFLILALVLFDTRPDNIKILQLPIGLGISLFLFSFFYMHDHLLSIFEVTGKKSLEIYLLSQYPLTLFKILLPKVPFLNGIFSLFINSILTLSLVFLFIWLLNQLHIYNYLFYPLKILKHYFTPR